MANMSQRQSLLSIFVLLKLLAAAVVVESQICFQNVTREIPVKRNNAFVRANITTTIKVCCDGYQLDPMDRTRCVSICAPEFAYSDGQCVPKCDNCENGECLSPNNCKCNDGYNWSPEHGCSPSCPEGCSNGVCIAPSVCRCSQGFYFTSTEGCVPIGNNMRSVDDAGADDDGPEVEGYFKYLGKKIHFTGVLDNAP
ncbi:epidermal growth factor-like protein [Musca domestica]|uniref:Epidermal growth factor-like protein n=1 Tax=Musca domestica TaxID=7370 RepID=A0ABM3VID1_MUSDO|nr:epidermal growth factor-like protein [Musca domestica]